MIQKKKGRRPSLGTAERARYALGNALYERWRYRLNSVDNERDLTMDGWRHEAQQTIDALDYAGFYIMPKPTPVKRRARP